MAEETELVAEVEAVHAVYGDDCRVLREVPPHLAVCIRPRTADVSSQQFVEVVIGIEVGPKYPEEAPCIKIMDSKGLDEQRHEHLIACMRAKAEDLSSCFMLVALCEEAVEILSNMNHPAGDCPLCLDPLFPEDKEELEMPFMKLMSCFHCFHCECIVRWVNWLQVQNTNNASSDPGSTVVSQVYGGLNNSTSKPLGNCPVCRQNFQSKDIEHVLNFMGTNSSQISEGNMVPDDLKALLQSDEEKSRRRMFESVLELQKEKGGVIERNKTKALVPGMFLPEPANLSATNTSAWNCNPIIDTTSVSVPSPDAAPVISKAKPRASTEKNVFTRRRITGGLHHRQSKTHHRKDGDSQSSRQWIQKERSFSRQ